MTGRDLIIYILQNDLEDEPLFKNNGLLDFMSEEQFAIKMDGGVATVRAWIELGCLTSVLIGDVYYIPKNYPEWSTLLNKRSEDNE